MPFSGLNIYGGAFLSKFECSQMPHTVGVAYFVNSLMVCSYWLIVTILSNFISLQLLEHVTFVDTPGVLSGEKQRIERSYDFTGVISWFAEKCDLILLLFDPHKLDISDEFKRVIGSLRGHHDKIRVVLNKADQVDTQQVRVEFLFIFFSRKSNFIMFFHNSNTNGPWCKFPCIRAAQLIRVYGALMWSLGKVLNTPEVARVYIGYVPNECWACFM